MNILDRIADAAVAFCGTSEKESSLLVGVLTIFIVCAVGATSVIWVLSWLTGLSMWWGWLALLSYYLYTVVRAMW